MASKKEIVEQEEIADFMLVEYATLRVFRQDLLTLGENRLNFFLAAVSGAIVGLALLNQIPGHEEMVSSVSGIIIMSLLFIGLITFARMIERSIGVVIYTRGINCIRRWFAEQSPSIKEYLVLPMSDEEPTFRATGFLSKGTSSLGLPEVVAVVNSSIAGIGAAILAGESLGLQIGWVCVLGGSVFLVALLLQNIYHVVRTREAERKMVIRFPTGG